MHRYGYVLFPHYIGIMLQKCHVFISLLLAIVTRRLVESLRNVIGYEPLVLLV